MFVSCAKNTTNIIQQQQVKIEDAGFDWKILGPDVLEQDYVAFTCDQDAYACRYGTVKVGTRMAWYRNALQCMVTV